jgi:hypothetical protein
MKGDGEREEKQGVGEKERDSERQIPNARNHLSNVRIGYSCPSCGHPLVEIELSMAVDVLTEM